MKNLSRCDQLLNEAYKFINNENYKEAENIINLLLSDSSSPDKYDHKQWECIANLSLYVGNIKNSIYAHQYSNNLPGYAFVLILNNQYQEAKDVLEKANKSPAYYWSLFLLELVTPKSKVKHLPTFLQIRHFLEFTVYQIIILKRYNLLEKIFIILPDLLEINTDCEKFVGYAYYRTGYIEDAIFYLKLSLARNQYDGEIYYRLGEIYLSNNEPFEALSMLTNAQLLLPDHHPTKLLIEKTKQLISLN
ncbi:MAG: hypothetical protein A3B68_03775 [Candidatus Melainabacteria bacterium RIFCSPHIGHO2_02_FULL_34_12]|nr:MAG: hypothetical protein A3B68_03775 [Candidatus Melainabacteria bacterium RIFCSPHIGHO2_02_FULL_34_12]